MKNINKYVALVAFGALVTFSGCESLELDLRDNPNALTPEQASVDFFMASIQEDFVRQWEGDADFDLNDNWSSGGATAGDGWNEHGQELTRMQNMFGRAYPSVYQNSDMDDEWRNCYRGFLSDVRAMNALAEEQGLAQHIGMSQFMEAYMMMSMVDFFGDVPYTEAIQGTELIFNPVVDPGQDIYEAMIVLLDQAIANFGAAEVGTPPDPFYGNDYSKWVLACNTLKLRAYITTSLLGGVTGAQRSDFNSIINSGNYIQNTEDDFEWNWPGTSNTQPDVRHPRYGINYTVTGKQEYQANHLMYVMDQANDPRIRYYFYRQTDAVPGAEIPPDEVTLNCSLQPAPQHYIDGGFPFCFLPNGYWGRDHGDDEGIPPDGLTATLPGVYPAGGKFDDDSFVPSGPGTGGGGTGVTVLLSAFGVDLMRAEVAMNDGDMTAARDFMLAAFDKQMAKVQAFLIGREAGGDTSFEPSAGDIATFRQTLSDDFDAGSMEDKWNIFGEQYLIAHFGNGCEPYNFYRRTLFPNNLKPNREPNPGSFITSMYYPANAVNNNNNISQKPDQSQPVFWDTSGIPPAN